MGCQFVYNQIEAKEKPVKIQPRKKFCQCPNHGKNYRTLHFETLNQIGK